MESEGDLHAKVSAWLHQTGYPFEMRVSARFRSAELSHAWERQANGEYVDSKTGEARETDFYLDLFHASEEMALCFRLVIECKNTKQPWVVFKQSLQSAPGRSWSIFDPAPNYTYYVERSYDQMSRYMRALMDRLEDHVCGYSQPGYAIAEAFKSANVRDVAHNAARQAISAAIGTSGDPDNFADTFGVSTTCPIIVTTSPLFDVTLTQDGQSLFVQQVASTTVWISQQVDRMRRVRVVICNESHLSTILSDCAYLEACSTEFFASADMQLIGPSDGPKKVRIG